ncbi:MAG: hypothetical protein COZ80_02625 [Ignavibacteria bacterium CG_4_8_14_3_um_filter_37_9]|nr:hypothetical protein [Ignavibacteria bacterium]OIO17770.1 MAG: hypothetical protein AUJ54_09335 [Ignavibacteria bacterium CG1_02_37_35]PIW99966.1 MAG: hypothetical protein COZ80_02625 [Ignavibacteria bacterium CG_4_8_14_3_um_filter_37_9]PIX93687.1 MAG: hypothetical protein COZ25_09355 [Ignavibacteria bacterium CG_4_10_14_3_um_filter_37_18]PJC57180.1 MAG: hypothetical protein CO025_14685 [Ignavibacteria bacterium CG_4_9_14_0_2_um_filter_37_13]
MKGYLSIVKYYPDTNRDEGFGIGLILISEETHFSLAKISAERLKRINTAYGIKKSSLIDLAIDEISTNIFDKKTLDYNTVYENGNLRYSKVQIIECEDLNLKFNELYLKFVADYYEEGADKFSFSKKEIHERLGRKLRSKLESNILLKEKLNIGYDFKENSIGKFLIGSSKIDFIGGNGTIYAGEIINLDLQEETLQQNLFKTITLFDALSKTYPKLFSPKECKMLVLEEQANNPEKEIYMDKLNTWNKKANYDLVIKSSLDEFQTQIEKDVESKNIIRYDEWIKKAV